MRRVASYRSHYVVESRNNDAAAHPAIAAGRPSLDRAFDEDHSVLDARRVHRNLDRGILDAASRQEAEMLLVDRRGDDQLALDIADYAARKNVGARKRIAIADRVHAVVDAEHGN